jgi:hypothetical protein
MPPAASGEIRGRVSPIAAAGELGGSAANEVRRMGITLCPRRGRRGIAFVCPHVNEAILKSVPLPKTITVTADLDFHDAKMDASLCTECAALAASDGSSVLRVTPDMASIVVAVSRIEKMPDAAFSKAREGAKSVNADLQKVGVKDFGSSAG